MSSSQQDRRLADGVLVTSKKRAYSEFVFDTEMGSLSNRKPRRRGPLKDSTIQGIESVKQEGGACWRCKMLKKPCDTGSPCRQCSNKNGSLWQIGCSRGNLHEQLQNKIPHIPGLGSDQWYLPTGDSQFLQISMEHVDPALEIRDLDLSNFRAGAGSHSGDLHLLRDFLLQFHHINVRLGDDYYPYRESTENAITQCAHIQWDAVSQSSLPLSQLPESALLIAKTLRALSYAEKLKSLPVALPMRISKDRFILPETIKVAKISYRIWKCGLKPELTSNKVGLNSEVPLLSMIQEIVHLTQRALLRRHPKDWPGLLCVLALFRLTSVAFRSCRPYSDQFDDSASALDRVLSILCELYHICTKGNHPLMEDWEWEDYARLVGNDEPAVGHFRSIRDIWVNSEERTNATDEYHFIYKMYSFLYD